MEIKIDKALLDRTFNNLPGATRRKAIVPALREGGKVIQTAAVANLNRITEEKSTGFLARNIVVRTLKKFRGMYRIAVQVRKGAVYPNKRDKNGAVRAALVGAVLEYRDGGKYSWIRKAGRDKAQSAISAVSKAVAVNIVSAITEAKK